MKEKYVQELIDKNEEAYDFISNEFNTTRAYLWYGLNNFSKYALDGQSILDFGCGNGRLVELFSGKKIRYTGVDTSSKLLNVAKEKYKDKLPENIKGAEFLKIDSIKLPFSDECFDNIYSIAALHHIPTSKLRINLLREFHRVLKPSGKIIITNWNLWQRKKYRKLIFKYAIKKVLGQFDADFKDVLVPWKNSKGKILAERYYHAFFMGEFKKIVKKANFKILESGYFGGDNNKANLYIVAKKL